MVSPNAPQEAVGLLYCRGTLLAEVRLAVHRTHRSFSTDLLSSSACTGAWCHSFPVQIFVVLAAELQKLFLQPSEAHLKGCTTIWHLSHSCLFSVISKLAESVLCPIIQIIKEKVEHYWLSYALLGFFISAWPPDGLPATDYVAFFIIHRIIVR